MPKKETSEKKMITFKLFKKIMFFKKVIMLNIKWDEKKDSILKSEKVLFSSPKYVSQSPTGKMKVYKKVKKIWNNNDSRYKLLLILK